MGLIDLEDLDFFKLLSSYTGKLIRIKTTDGEVFKCRLLKVHNGFVIVDAEPDVSYQIEPVYIQTKQIVSFRRYTQ